MYQEVMYTRNDEKNVFDSTTKQQIEEIPKRPEAVSKRFNIYLNKHLKFSYTTV